MTIAQTTGGSQMDVSPWIQYNINAGPLLGGGQLVGNVATGSRLTTSQPGFFEGLLSNVFRSATNVASAGIRTAGSIYGDTARAATNTTVQAIRSGTGTVHDTNETIRNVGDNVEGTAKAAAWGIGSYVLLGIGLLIFAGAILYVPPKALGGGK